MFGRCQAAALAQLQRADRARRRGTRVGQLFPGPRRAARPSGAYSRPRKTTASIKGILSVVLSYDYWVTRFGADTKVIGQKLLVNNYPMTIVGVSAAGFIGIDPGALAADSRSHPDEAADDAGLGRDRETGAASGSRCSPV